MPTYNCADIADTYSQSGSFADVNSGTSTVLAITDTNRMYLKFDLSPIPAGAVINSATMVLDQQTSWSNSTVTVSRVTANWTETGLTWNTAPGYGNNSLGGISTFTTASGYHNVDVTQYMKDWMAGSYVNYGLTCVHGVTAQIVFNSRESAIAPYLAVDYNVTTKYWNGSAWVSSKDVKYWNGSAWTSATGIKYWNGTAWVNTK